MNALKKINLAPADKAPLAQSGTPSKRSYASREWKQLPNEDIYTYCDRIEAALHMQEERVSAIVEESNIAIWEWERRNDIIRVSPYFYEQLGLKPPAGILRLGDVLDLLHPEDRKSLYRHFRKFLKSGQRFSLNCRFADHSGENIRMNLSGKVTFDANHRISHISGSLSEVSAQIKASDLLYDNDTTFERAFAEAVSGFAIVRHDGRITYANRSLCKLLGYSASELVGRSMVEVMHPEDRSISLQDSFLSSCGALSSEGLEKRFMRRDDEHVWARFDIIYVHYDTQGLPVHYVAEVTDLSETKRAEQERLQLEAALRHAQAMEMIGTLTSGVAHDLNNLLTPIVGYTDIVIDECTSNPEAIKCLEVIRESTDRARDLVKNMLLFCHKEEAKPTMVKMSSVVERCLLLLRPIVPGSVSVQLLQDTDRDYITLESRQIHQVMMNLATNALHAMKDSGGTLIFRISETAIEGQAFGELGLIGGKYVCIEVSDTGTGMNDDVASRIFDPFFTTKSPDEGTGLGLFVVNGIIRRHEGAIALTSSPDAGATFKIYLPMAETHVEKVESLIAEPSKLGIRIMWVDDDRLVVDLGKKMLEYLGYQAICHTSPAAALDDLENEHSELDLIISDSAMPGFRGEQFVSIVRAKRPDLPIIVCSGLPDHAERIGTCHATAILPKPFTVKELSHAISSTLSESQRMNQGLNSVSVGA